MFNRNTGEVIAKIPTGDEPDGALFDAHTGLVFVMNGASEDVTVINLAERKVVKTIPMGGKPEAAVSDNKGRVYINIEDTAEIVVLELASLNVLNRYKLPGCHEPTGIAYDDVSGLLISACHNGTVKLIEANTGADRGSLTIGQDADGAIFDRVRRLVYIPCFDGTLSIFSLDDSGKGEIVQVIETQIGARTIGLDAASGKLYLPATDYTFEQEGKKTRVPGTFKVLVIAKNSSDQ